MSSMPLYLDYNATTPTDPEVAEAMLPWLTRHYGNPSSRHEYGRVARQAVDEARAQVADALGAHPTEVIFTSGGSEANNLLIKGAAGMMTPGVVAVGATEHPCVLEPARALKSQGWQPALIPVDAAGLLSQDSFSEFLAGQRPKLLSLMMANNETGVIQDIEACAQQVQAQRPGCLFHTDAVQAFGKVPLNFRALNRAGVRAMTVSAHKIGGPRGVAALVLDKRVSVQPLIAGGGHERGLRSGTENVAAIVGMGVAAQRAVAALAAGRETILALRLRLEEALLAMGALVFARQAPRLDNTVFCAFSGADGETLVGKLDRAGFAVASGSACSSAQPEPSHVLLAMGVPADLARSAVRVSLGPETNVEQIDLFIHTLRLTLGQLHALTALSERAVVSIH